MFLWAFVDKLNKLRELFNSAGKDGQVKLSVNDFSTFPLPFLLSPCHGVDSDCLCVTFLVGVFV